MSFSTLAAMRRLDFSNTAPMGPPPPPPPSGLRASDTFCTTTDRSAASAPSTSLRMAYEAYVAKLSKLGEMYAGLTRNAYKPVERAGC